MYGRNEDDRSYRVLEILLGEMGGFGWDSLHPPPSEYWDKNFWDKRLNINHFYIFRTLKTTLKVSPNVKHKTTQLTGSFREMSGLVNWVESLFLESCLAKPIIEWKCWKWDYSISWHCSTLSGLVVIASCFWFNFGPFIVSVMGKVAEKLHGRERESFHSPSSGPHQTGPLSLVEVLHYCALIGRELHSDVGASNLMP